MLWSFQIFGGFPESTLVISDWIPLLSENILCSTWILSTLGLFYVHCGVCLANCPACAWGESALLPEGMLRTLSSCVFVGLLEVLFHVFWSCAVSCTDTWTCYVLLTSWCLYPYEITGTSPEALSTAHCVPRGPSPCAPFCLKLVSCAVLLTTRFCVKGTCFYLVWGSVPYLGCWEDLHLMWFLTGQVLVGHLAAGFCLSAPLLSFWLIKYFIYIF